MGSGAPAPLIGAGLEPPIDPQTLMPFFNQVSGVGSGQGSGFSFPSPNGFSQFFTPWAPSMMASPYIPTNNTPSPPSNGQPSSPASDSMASNPFGGMSAQQMYPWILGGSMAELAGLQPEMF